MSHTYNATFVTSPDKEKELLKYLTEYLLPEVTRDEFSHLSPSLKKVVEAGGEKPGPEEGLSIALAVDFPNEERAHLWHDHILLPVLEDFHRRFGDQALFFITLLKHL